MYKPVFFSLKIKCNASQVKTLSTDLWNKRLHILEFEMWLIKWPLNWQQNGTLGIDVFENEMVVKSMDEYTFDSEVG